MSSTGRRGQRPPCRRPPARADGGSATIYAVAGIALLSVMALTASFLVGALAAKHRAGAAADLAALAAAGAMRAGADACGAAAAIASRNGASLTACSEQSGSVTVEVRTAAPSLLGMTIDAAGIARAGWAAPH